MNHTRLLPTGRSGEFLTDVQEPEWIPLPDGAVLAWLPGTRAVGIDPEHGQFVSLDDACYAVGALLPQGFTRLLLPGYAKRKGDSGTLPLFGYTAVGWLDDQVYVAAHRTDDPDPWNPAAISDEVIEQAVSEVMTAHPDNRLVEHLSHCALTYGCMTAKNTFLGRVEGALPVSSTCNAGCVGCISEQPDDSPFPSPQTRLSFRPNVDEMVETMLLYLEKNPQGITSFGQGCEGEPSTRWMDIAQAIRVVRSQTSSGYINMNTNAGLTKGVQAIVDAGLDMMRVSIISARDEHYNAYYRPRGYTLADVEASLRYAASRGVYTSLNYLVFPGVSDREEEIDVMAKFIKRTGVRLVQLRNLNIDPDYYLQRIPRPDSDPQGMLQMMKVFQVECPGVILGSYSHRPTGVPGANRA